LDLAPCVGSLGTNEEARWRVDTRRAEPPSFARHSKDADMIRPVRLGLEKDVETETKTVSDEVRKECVEVEGDDDQPSR
jgi:hypothetical protein